MGSCGWARCGRGGLWWALSVVALAVGGGCASDDSQPFMLGLFAFPEEIEPGGETVIAVQLAGACADGQTRCTLCVAAPAGDDGVGLSPATAPTIAQHVVRFYGTFDSEPITLVYHAPAQEGHVAVIANLYSGKNAPCELDSATTAQGIEMPVDGLVATTAVFVSVVTGGSGEDAGGAAKDSGGSGEDGRTDAQGAIDGKTADAEGEG